MEGENEENEPYLIDRSILGTKNSGAESFVAKLSADVVFHKGRIDPKLSSRFREFIEEVANGRDLEHHTIAVFSRDCGKDTRILDKRSCSS